MHSSKRRNTSRQPKPLEPLEPRTLLSVTLTPVNTQTIDPTRQTWVVIHGRGDSPAGMAPISDALSKIRDPQNQFFQVLALDWSQDAHPATSTDFSEEANIPIDGQAAADALKALGFTASLSAANLNLIGHSWGADIAYEISKDLAGGVNRLVALDPAQDAKILSQGSDTYDTDAADFAANSQYALAFLSSLWGSETAAARADDSIIVGYDNTSWGYASLTAQDTTAHSLIKDLFSTILRNNRFAALAAPISHLFAPDQLTSSRTVPWKRNHFSVTDSQGFLSYGSPNPYPAGVTIGESSGPFDAEIRAAKTTDGAATVWYPYSLRYYTPSSGNPNVDVSTTIAETFIKILPGDTNLDGKVDFADLVAVAQNYGGHHKLRSQGDLTDDGNVDFADLVQVAQNYGQPQAAPLPAPAPLPTSSSKVPAAKPLSKPTPVVFAIKPIKRNTILK